MPATTPSHVNRKGGFIETIMIAKVSVRVELSVDTVMSGLL